MLENKAFYFNTSRKIVIAFGNLFNNLSISRLDSNDNKVKDIKVPLAFAPKNKYLVRLNKELNDPAIQTTFPRISFELLDINYDPGRQISPLNRKLVKNISNSNVILRQLNPTPFNFGFSLDIYAKHTDDALQIIEQILPYFSPSFNVSIIDIPLMNITRDIPITLEGTTPNDNYEGDFNDELRRINWTLNFVAKGYLYLPIKDTNVIKNIYINFLRTSDASNKNPEDLLEQLGLSVNPSSAFLDDIWTVDTTITPGVNT